MTALTLPRCDSDEGSAMPKYSWQDEYRQAVREVNPLQVEAALNSARNALLERLRQLDETHQVAKEERAHIGEALASIDARISDASNGKLA